ncbi:MAG: hypothetical protein CO129_04220 [Ignavibacteriales bacterium CG_4_9_14_3_um_filter_34_10]|nr:MAG: hypothetical protein CO129_04220 [Ignavibacteriales bacterium CG_4_9_14_3_um_filter_34_10]
MKQQEELKLLIKALNIKYSWLAEKLGINTQTLSYLLHEAEKIDDDLYDSIKKIIDSYQFELKLFEDDKLNNNFNLFDEKQLKKEIGQRIRVFAKRKYGTLKNLAEAISISPQQLQQYISGNREPGSKILIKFLRIGADINWLLSGNESIDSFEIYKLEHENKVLHAKLKQINQIVLESKH